MAPTKNADVANVSKKADEILDELFTAIKEEKMSTTTSDSDADSDSEAEERRKKKKRKKHKKEKKKKKDRRSSESEEEEASREDNFWGGSHPYEEKEKERKKEREKNGHHRDREDDGARKRERDTDDRKRDERRATYDRKRDHADLDRDRREDRGQKEDREYKEDRGHKEDRDSHRGQYDRDVRKEYDRGDRSDRRGSDRGSYDRKDERREEKRRSSKERKIKKESGSIDEDGGGKGGGGGGDGFWDTKWDAMQLEEKLAKGEKRGRYYLNTKKRFKDATNNKQGTPSLTPSPERKKKKHDDSDSETEEFKRLKRMRDVMNLKVDGDGLVQGPIADASNYEYDKMSRMYRKKVGMIENEKKKMKGSDKEEELISSSSSSEEDDENKKVVEELDDLVKDIEEIENDLEKKKKQEATVVKVDTNIDWGDSALGHLVVKEEAEEERKKKEAKEKKKSKKKAKEGKKEDSDLEDGEVDDRKEDGEVDSEEERRMKKVKKERRSYSRDRRDSYSRRRSMSRDRDRERRRSRSPYSRDRRGKYDRDSRGRDRDRDTRSRGRDRRSRDRSRSNDRRRDRSNSVDRERQREDRYERNKRRQERHERSKINKERLLEIAKKNAAKILKSGGDFMGMDHDKLVAMKSGGQSLDELTKFCRELARKGLEDKDKIDFLAESESDTDEEEDFRHPFMVKDRPLPNPITMLLGAGEKKETLPPAAKAVAKSQRMLEFPVSSGNAHREKIKTTGEELADPDIKLAIEMKREEDEMVKFHEQMEAEEKELSKIGIEIKPWTLSEEDKNIVEPNLLGKTLFKGPEKELPPEKLEEINKLKPKPIDLKTLANQVGERLALPAPTDPIAPEPKLSTDPDKVFDTTAAPVVDIGTIVSKRLNAQRQLQVNPQDPIALQEMYEAQKQMEQWAVSKNRPGQFLGSTGAKVLPKHEFNTGVQAYAKKEQFTKAERVRGGFGEFMLKKMGWEEGEGIGKHKQGDANPLTLEIKFDKKGLMAAEEEKRGSGVVTLTGCKDLAGKHPVSALTELCSKRRWGPPIFSQAFECGPPHKKQFIFKVTVDGKDYMANVAVDNKKKAKSNAAMCCLIAMGLVPKDPDNPV